MFWVEVICRVVLLIQVGVLLLPEDGEHCSVSRVAFWGFLKRCRVLGILFKYLLENKRVFTLSIFFVVALSGRNNQ